MGFVYVSIYLFNRTDIRYIALTKISLINKRFTLFYSHFIWSLSSLCWIFYSSQFWINRNHFDYSHDFNARLNQAFGVFLCVISWGPLKCTGSIPRFISISINSILKLQKNLFTLVDQQKFWTSKYLNIEKDVSIIFSRITIKYIL